jgi:hypothetical protein
LSRLLHRPRVGAATAGTGGLGGVVDQREPSGDHLVGGGICVVRQRGRQPVGEHVESVALESHDRKQGRHRLGFEERLLPARSRCEGRRGSDRTEARIRRGTARSLK